MQPELSAAVTCKLPCRGLWRMRLGRLNFCVCRPVQEYLDRLAAEERYQRDVWLS